jgi:hypothetical protein
MAWPAGAAILSPSTAPRKAFFNGLRDVLGCGRVRALVLARSVLALGLFAAASRPSSSSAQDARRRLGGLLSSPAPARPQESPELLELERRLDELAARPDAEVAAEAIDAGRRALGRAREALAKSDARRSTRMKQLVWAALELASRRLAAHAAAVSRDAAARRLHAAQTRARAAHAALEATRERLAKLRTQPP